MGCRENVTGARREREREVQFLTSYTHIEEGVARVRRINGFKTAPHTTRGTEPHPLDSFKHKTLYFLLAVLVNQSNPS